MRSKPGSRNSSIYEREVQVASWTGGIYALRSQCLVQLVNDLIDRLYPDREPDRRRLILITETGADMQETRRHISHRPDMGCTFGKLVDELTTAACISRKIEGYHRGKATMIEHRLGQFMVRMLGKTCVSDLRNRWMTVEKLGD